MVGDVVAAGLVQSGVDSLRGLQQVMAPSGFRTPEARQPGAIRGVLVAGADGSR